jgi:hypothetical protein
MAIGKITGQGLAAIALSVVVLWGCFIAERLMVMHARREFSRTIQQNRALKTKRLAEPASRPDMKFHQPIRPAIS